MEASNDANATQLPSSLPSLEPLTIHDDQQQTATHNLQEQTVGIMEDQQPRVVYHIEADGEGEAEDIHIVRNSKNTIDFFAGIQHPEVDVNSIESESEGEIQELDMGDVSPVQCDSNVGGDIQEDFTTTNNSLPLTNATEVAVDISGNPHQLSIPVDKAYHDVNDEERGIFVDFDGDADVDDDEEMSIQEQDNEIEEDVGTGLGFDAVTSLRFYDIKAVTCSQTSEIIAKHLSMPNPQSFESLESLLSSHNAPGRGLYNIEKALEHEDGRISELEEKIQYIQAELEETRARRHRADDIARKARATFSQTHIRAGISNQLWAEYEAFCESLEPKFGNRGGWSITCYEDHKGSYLQWDPDLDLFLESAEMHLGSCNFRCEATAIKSKESTEYVVEFWPLASPEPEVGRTGAAKTWKQQYPELYRIATEAANSSTEDNTVAKELLKSLPHPRLPFSGGWLFEYVLEPARAQHPIVSRRWSYRSAQRLPVDEQQDQVDVMADSEPDAADTQDEDDDAEYVESEEAESEDMKMEEDDLELANSQDVKMEVDDE